MFQSVKGRTENFLNIIKFNKDYYIIYNDIFNDKIELTYEIFVFFILQAAYNNKFYGYFDELYVDVIKRKSDYKKELTNNFKIAFIGEPLSNYNIFSCCVKQYNEQKDKELFFSRAFRTYFDIDDIINQTFQLNDEEKKNKFINFCEILYDKKMNEELNLRITPKTKKKISFKLFTRQ